MKNLFLVIFSFTLQIAKGQNTSDIIEKELSRCLEESFSTANQRDCINKAYEDWDKLLNQTYQSLIKELSEESKIQLKESQRNWLKYRDTEFNFINKYYFQDKQGTLNYVIADSKKMEIIKQRTLMLLEYLKEIDE